MCARKMSVSGSADEARCHLPKLCLALQVHGPPSQAQPLTVQFCKSVSRDRFQLQRLQRIGGSGVPESHLVCIPSRLHLRRVALVSIGLVSPDLTSFAFRQNGYASNALGAVGLVVLVRFSSPLPILFTWALLQLDETRFLF